MRDLDMADVLADAEAMMAEHYHQMWFEFDKQSDAELGQARYNRGAEAREGCFDAIMVVTCIDMILLHRHTSLCEGCLGRTGCDMCCPPDFSWMADAYNREAEETMLGRPLFPNEY